jgi:hypothetical protein
MTNKAEILFGQEIGSRKLSSYGTGGAASMGAALTTKGDLPSVAGASGKPPVVFFGIR